MKIALISEHASPLADLGSVDSGGQNIYVAQVAKNLAGMGHQVDVFTRRDDPSQPEIIEWENGARVIHVPAGPADYVRKENLLQYMQAFTDYMIQFCSRTSKPYDLVHANFWMSGLVAADIKLALGIPFVITFHALGRVRRLHQGEADGFPEERFTIEDRIVAEADQIIAECPQDKEDLIRLYHAEPDKITIVPCGFDPDELWPLDKEISRKLLNLPKEEKIILQLGRMVPRKGVETVIQGFSRLIKEYKISARLLVIGGESDEPDPEATPEIGRLQAVATREGVTDRVTFVGRRGRKALKHYYSASDIFVSTPWYEPFGITPVEAMACGTPVVGSNVGGIKYTVCHGETGYLVPSKDPDALAKRLAELLNDPDRLERFSQQAIQRANELFTWQKVTQKLVKLYEKILASVDPSIQVKTSALSIVQSSFDLAIEAFQRSKLELSKSITDCAQAISNTLAEGGKVMVCGNGGSAAEAQHFAAEFVGRFKMIGRPALPVLALTADTAFITAWSNDTGFDQIFSRQVEAYGQTGDVLLGISTSGGSRNLVEAFLAARRKNLTTIAILGGNGGELLPLADYAVLVPSYDTARIQEVQLFVLHLICELVEGNFIRENLMAGEALLPVSQQGVRSIWDLGPASRLSVAGDKVAGLDDLPLSLRKTSPATSEKPGRVNQNGERKNKNGYHRR